MNCILIFALLNIIQNIHGMMTLTGVDVSQPMSASSASCFVSSGYSYAIPRGYTCNCNIDSSVCTTLVNAYNAGITVRDVYLFPC